MKLTSGILAVAALLAGHAAKAQQTYNEMEQLTVNEQVTTVITATEPIRFVDISTDKIAGDQPINNTVRLTIYSKRFLIHTMKLVGAGWGFIRRPFLRRNFWVGLSSGVLADAVLVAAAYTLVSYEPGLLAVITTDILLWVMLSTLLFGVLITCMCAYISINKYLRLSAGDLYYM